MTRNYRRCLLAAAILASLNLLFISGFARAHDYSAGTHGYLKSATYYSDDWVINFWNSESLHMEEELAQIANDGFNNIILVIPWREFQPEMRPARYNAYAWDKLDRVMDAAARHNLSVMLRVGYTWDYYAADNASYRFRDLMYDQDVKEAWMDYVKRLYQRASAHGNFCGGFITWEDFWNFTDAAVVMGRGQQSKDMARKCGFVDYAREHYSLQEISALYGEEFTSWSQLYLPDRTSPALRVFYEFYDDFLNRILADSQTVFPNLSMEVRLDEDPVRDVQGMPYGYVHHATYGCGGSTYTSVMFSVVMGHLNNYERLEAGQAAAMSSSILDRVRAVPGVKPLYLDQFLFSDNTVGFEHNARLDEGQITPYLINMAPVLKDKTMGYGIWTYRNYCDNMVYNSQFALGSEQWVLQGGSSIVELDGNHMAKLPPHAQILQNIGGRVVGNRAEGIKVCFDVSTGGRANLTVRINHQERAITVGDKERVELNFSGKDSPQILITSMNRDVYIDNIKVYTYVTDGQMYDMDGNEMECMAGVRAMNQMLQ